ncbi:class I SAM-dependent methyltransferase [Candidatus Babeliales bacterium]|nr:class I SAM-dependent methyltransferase [Candidatus Babeliales bacterium]
MQKQKEMGKSLKHEFDDYIEKYREIQNKDVRLSGETGEFFAEYKIEKMASWFPEYLDQPIDMLDFGCGDGLMTQYAHKYFPKATIQGVDPSSKSIEHAKHTCKDGIQFDVLEDDTLPYEDKKFDLVYAAGVFHHIKFNQHEHFIRELARITKKGGRIIIFELNPFNPLTVHTFRNSPIDQNATLLFPRYTKSISESIGKVSTKYYCFFPSFARKLRVLEPYMTWLPAGALYATIIEVEK